MPNLLDPPTYIFPLDSKLAIFGDKYKALSHWFSSSLNLIIPMFLKEGRLFFSSENYEGTVRIGDGIKNLKALFYPAFCFCFSLCTFSHRQERLKKMLFYSQKSPGIPGPTSFLLCTCLSVLSWSLPWNWRLERMIPLILTSLVQSNFTEVKYFFQLQFVFYLFYISFQVVKHL